MRATIVDPLTQLGRLPVAEFMRRCWQKRPVLLRQALPDFAAPVSVERLFALAADDDVESRLVTAFNGRWRLRHGPFAAAELPSRTRQRWTLLVQGVDRHDAAAHALRSRFRFVPDARLDDVMVSFATNDGGVGPHVDSYDVFLVQAQGRRRWRISRSRNLALRPGLPLAILARFTPTHEWVLEPGDVLYLPPGVAHEGVAIGECMTCSIGFRAPRWQDLVAPWHAWLEESTRLRGAYADPDLKPTRTPGRLPPRMIDASLRALSQRQPTHGDAEAMLLRLLSEPKSNVVFDRRVRPLARREILCRARRRGVALDARTRMLYSGRRVAINGELLATRCTTTLRRLADHRMIAGRDADDLVARHAELLYQWYVAGWLQLLRA
jgi:50S ribosomal protein L16 3-hydroxylase